MPNIIINFDSEYRTFTEQYSALWLKFQAGIASIDDLIAFQETYLPGVKTWTKPISIQLSEGFDNTNPKLYLHPQTHIPKQYHKHPVYSAPFAPLQYIQDINDWHWETYDTSEDIKRKENICINLYWFWSLQDIRFLFKDDEDYKRLILPYIKVLRRATTEMGRKIPLPYRIKMPNKKGFMRWHYVSLKLFDISAMQGRESLNTYAKNVGINLVDKGLFDGTKNRMDVNYMVSPEDFEDYALGDLPIANIAKFTNDFYNEIAKLIGVEPRDEWGYSTGKIVASIVSAWMVKNLKIDSKKIKSIDVVDVVDKVTKKIIVPGFYKLNEIATPKKLNAISVLESRKELVYLGMTDGGRAIKERPHINYYPFDNLGTKINTLLIDIDISGCYGNGLLNQDFAVGHPVIETQSLKFGEWEKKYKSKLVPGLWTARISWIKAPFKQDILISKTDEVFSNWDFAVQGYKPSGNKSDDEFNFEICDIDEQVFDASMFLATDSIHQAALTHDSLQVLMNYLSNTDKKWLRDNAVIESFGGYLKDMEVTAITDKMLDTVSTKTNLDKKSTAIEWSTEWYRVPLKNLLSVLLAERKKYKKKTPMNTFLKLIINTIYGCIASIYFGEKGTGISNYIVGNNITSRARVLAWCMAKGFHSFMSVTDGGVFDFNKVLNYKVKSLSIFEQVSRDEFIRTRKFGKGGEIVINQVSLANEGYITPEQLIEWCLKVEPELNNYADGKDEEFLKKYPDAKSFYLDKNHGEILLTPVNKLAWEHLKNIFSELDIFKYDQFKFECKNWYTSIEIHSKVDYRLINSLNNNRVIALRGKRMKTDEQKLKANQLFDAIKTDNPIHIEDVTEELISFNDWDNESENYPHDTIIESKRFYSHTPLGCRFTDKGHFKRVMRRYEGAKKSQNAEMIADVKTE